MGPNSMACVLLRRRASGYTQQERRPCEGRSRDWSNASTSQGMLTVIRNHQNLGARRGPDPSLPASGGTSPANTLFPYFQPAGFSSICLGQNHSSSFAMPSFWYFALVTLGNEHPGKCWDSLQGYGITHRIKQSTGN